MRKYILILFIILSQWVSSASLGDYIQNLSDQAQIQLITCTQGEQVWSKYGHTGIRLIDPEHHIDIVFNYGIFNLMSDDFYAKFVKGETYYQLGIEDYQEFVDFYGSIGRRIYWQELNLTQAQKQRIANALWVNYQPQNRYYLYNFVFDNCATRPYHLIKEALQDSIISDYEGYKGTDYRSAISHYTGSNSWIDFGINLLFGSDANTPMTNEDRLFLPEELMNYFANARLADGTPLVKRQNIGEFEPVHVPWYANCWVGIVLFAILMTVLSYYDRRRKRLTWAVDAVLGLIYLLLIVLVIYLTCFSCHPLVGFNWRLILFPIIHICARLVYFVHR
jgi:hypothetical protein